MPGHGWRVSIRNIISGNFNCEKFLYFSILLTSGLPAFPGIFNHMNRLLSLLLFVGSLSCYGQINFEKGYVITNGGEREQVWIRNVGWKDNPEVFTYKTSPDAGIQQGTLNTIREFGIPDRFKFVRAQVPIDQSSDKLKYLTKHGRPIQDIRQVFLNLLVEGKANLYSYQDENREQFFYQLDAETIEPLIYKRYVPEGTSELRSNNQYKQQLWNNFKCGQMTMEDLQKLDYGRNELTEFFIAFNSCQDASFEDFTAMEKQRDAFDLFLRAGLAINSVELNNYAYGRHLQMDGYKSPRIGLEMAYILPFYRNKLAFIVETAYQSFEGEGPFGDGSLKVRYHSIEVPLMVRHYFFLNKDWKLFANAGYTLDIALEGSEMKFDTNLNAYSTSDIDTFLTNPTIGAGLDFQNRYALEVRYSFDRSLTNGSMYWGSTYNSFSVSLGYNFL